MRGEEADDARDSHAPRMWSVRGTKHVAETQNLNFTRLLARHSRTLRLAMSFFSGLLSEKKIWERQREDSIRLPLYFPILLG